MIESLGERFNIREIAFDRWGAVQMVQNLENMGFTVIPFGQGFKDMSPPTKELMKLTLEQRIAHGGHPVLRWMMDNVCAKNDPAGNVKMDKEKSTEKVAVLEEGMKYTPISISPEQAQFLETRKFQINEIARIFRVPPHMVGDLEKSSFSNIEQQSLEFVKYTLDPWVIRWEQSIQRTLFSPEEKKKYFVKFNVEGLLRGDYQSRMQGYATARQNGWMSANDIRELENLDRIPDTEGGDLYLVNGNMLPLTSISQGNFYTEQPDAYSEDGKEDNSDEKVLEVEESGGSRKRTRRESSVSERNNS